MNKQEKCINLLFIFLLLSFVSNMSMKITTLTNCKPLSEGCIILYERCNYQGKFYMLCNGEMRDIYDYFDYNIVGSVMVSNNTQFFYWNHTNFKGTFNTLDHSRACINKPMPSIKVILSVNNPFNIDNITNTNTTTNTSDPNNTNNNETKVLKTLDNKIWNDQFVLPNYNKGDIYFTASGYGEIRLEVSPLLTRDNEMYIMIIGALNNTLVKVFKHKNSTESILCEGPVKVKGNNHFSIHIDHRKKLFYLLRNNKVLLTCLDPKLIQNLKFFNIGHSPYLVISNVGAKVFISSLIKNKNLI